MEMATKDSLRHFCVKTEAEKWLYLQVRLRFESWFYTCLDAF